MSKYRIQKEGREFTAGRLETLRELAERGLLRPEDPVSVDGAPFRPAQDIEGLAGVLDGAEPAEDPWRHWGQADEDLDGEDDVLTSFLDRLSSGTLPAVADAPVLTPHARSIPVAEPEPEPPHLDPMDLAQPCS